MYEFLWVVVGMVLTIAILVAISKYRSKIQKAFQFGENATEKVGEQVIAVLSVDDDPNNKEVHYAH
ncbi:hypothetical protein LCGC14_1906140 [marine sediment metagenome]|uniref:Uncharacterized protein n=1 Tax=marine sediment metagenome TaxID=412755 RepID=A0A0F9GIG5_9ZZZZ